MSEQIQVNPEFVVGSESFEHLSKRLRYNDRIADYYEFLADENIVPISENCSRPDERLENKARRLRGCAQLWTVDWHQFLNLKELVDAGLCRDRFCVNCQSALASAREHKFTPIIEETSKGKKVFHLTLTVRNCSGKKLRHVIDKMYKSFYYLTRYLSGSVGISGLNFSSFGYVGAVRSVEVTYNKELKTYHPHLHCLMTLSDKVKLNKNRRNVFSYSREHSDVKFYSEEEVFIQKIWYLLNNSIKVTQEAIDFLDRGYSAVLNEVQPEDYKEVFKYPFKGDLNVEKCLDYEQFKVYQSAFKNLRFVEGYGAFRKHEFENVGLTSEDLEIGFKVWKRELEKMDPAIRLYESVKEVEKNISEGNGAYFTSGSYKKHVLSKFTEERLTEESKDVLSEFNKKFK